MTFKVGDKVRVTNGKYSGINYEPYAVVTRVAGHGAMLCRGECSEHMEEDKNNWHFFFMNGDFELIGKTLQELNVQVGDVVATESGTFRYTVALNEKGNMCDESDMVELDKFSRWHIVSLAAIIEPTPPRKMHPDDFVKAVNDFARDNVFGVTKIEFGSTAVDGGLVRHSYSV